MNQGAVTVKLGFLDLYRHRRLALFMSFSIAITVMLLLILEVYRTAMEDKYAPLPSDYLVVQSSQSLGEFYGSRLAAKVGEDLVEKGISFAIPEVRALAGTSAKNAIMLRGVIPGQYEQLEGFTIIKGKKLETGDPTRSAMIGWRLSTSRDLDYGDQISLRGRYFQIIGVFKTGTYMDNQVWVFMEDAQNLLGWGEDISVYFVPDDGILAAGDELPGGVSVTRMGENLTYIREQVGSIVGLLKYVVAALSISVVIGFTMILWRMAWLRRRDMAILRATGFSASSLFGYLISQAAIILLIGVLIGVLLTVSLTASISLLVPSFTLVPRLDMGSALVSLGVITLIWILGSFLPAIWMARLNLISQLNAE